MPVKEVLIGLALGYVTLPFFTTFEIAGAFVDFQVGFSMGQIYDPALGVNASFYGRIYYWISMMIFFIADIHHHVIRSLVNSFEWAPLELLSFNHFGMKGIMHLFSQMFQTAVRLAIPLIIVAILSELTLALISRTVPTDQRYDPGDADEDPGKSDLHVLFPLALDAEHQ
ncbi:MAG: flagellar biosynthetic protein FliR [Alkalibacterium sp.]|nr:flagellar biosynthetic protein FliR [Alkalibacterium sp.]